MVTFGAAAFLFGGVLLAVPIIAHLIQREIAISLRFPSTRFIRVARRPQQERRRIRDLFLLFLRMLMLAALVLALAQPRWLPAGGASALEAENVTVLLVDQSASMDGWGGWSEAGERIAEILRDRPDRPVGLILYADAPWTILPPTLDHAELERTLAAASPLPLAGRPAEAVREALRLFGNAGERELIIVSDFQETDWLTDLPDVPADFSVVPVKVGETARAEQPNLGITGVEVFPVGDQGSRAVVRVRNHGSEPAGVRVRLVLDDGEELEQTASVPAGQARPVVFESTSRERVGARAELLEGGAFAGDDVFHFWMGPPPPLRVLAFMANFEEPERAEEFFFVQTALGVEVEGDWVRFEADSLDRAFLRGPTLRDAEAVFLPGTAAYLDSVQWEALRTFVEEGGVLVVTPGRSPMRVLRGLENAGLADLRFRAVHGGATGRREFLHPAWLNPESSLAAVFEENSREDLYRVSILRGALMEAGRETATILRGEGGEVLLGRTTRGQGVVYVLAFGLDPQSSDLPLRNSFLPLVREMFGDGATVESGLVRLATGESPPPGLFPGEGPGAWQRVPGLLEEDGFYVAINIPATEGVPATVDPSRRFLDTSGAIFTGDRAPFLPAHERGGVELWPWLLLILLITLLIEFFAAFWMGRTQGSANQPVTA
ncbi:MAG: VWA domain-containing protein [Opitutales bacterium]|nr:VWA domain-containing protein [Opitutales bacterium]